MIEKNRKTWKRKHIIPSILNQVVNDKEHLYESGNI